MGDYTLEQALAMASESAGNVSDDAIHVNIDTREVTVPESQKLFGVESDDSVEIKHIVIDGRYADGNRDLSKLTWRVIYRNAHKDSSYYLIPSIVVNENSIEMDWLIKRSVVVFKGTIDFIVCGFATDSTGATTPEWNSTLGQGYALEGLEVSAIDIGKESVDELAKILNKTIAARDIAKAASDEATKTAASMKNSLDQIDQNTADIAKNTSSIAALKDGKISKFYASSQGNTNLPDSDDGRIMDLKLYGKSEQKQYAGRNLWSGKNLESYWMGDDETQNNDCVSSDFISVDGAKTIYAGFSYDWAVGYTCYDSNKNKIDGSTLQINSTTSGAEKVYEIRASANKTPENTAYIKFMYSKHEQKPYVSIVEGAYEPYVGGIPSPNPEYPQEIKSVVKPTVKVCGKNLVQKIVYGYINQSNAVQIDDSSVSAIAYVIKGKEYTISCPIIMDRFKVGIIDASAVDSPNGASCEVIIDNQSNTTVKNFRSTSTGYAFIYINSTKNESITNKLQVECGSVATDYEPYTEQIVTLPYTLNAIPVTSGGNVTIDGQQYIADYVNIERGKLVRMLEYKKVVAAKVEDLTDAKRLYITTDDIWDRGTYTARSFPLMCSIGDGNLVTVSNNGWSGKSKCVLTGMPFATLTDAKTYFDSHDAYICYLISTPTETDLTADEIAAFKALASHYPVTNVSTTSDQLDGYTVFDYPISLANGWNYVKQQLGDTRDYLYGIDLMTAEAYVNSEYAAALAEIEV